MSIFEQVEKTVETSTRTIAWGQIVSVGPPLSVRLARDTTNITVTHWLSSYTPTTSDKVVLVRVGSQWIVLGDYVDA